MKNKKTLFISLTLFILLLVGICTIPVSAVTYKLDTPEIEYIANSESGISMSWTQIEGAATYTILRKIGETGSWTKKVVTTETHWTDTSVVSGKTYYYAVRCSNADGTKYTSLRNPDGSMIFCIRSRNISVSNKVNGINLSWTKIDKVTQYEVMRRLKGEQDWNVIAVTNTCKYLDETVESGVQYQYSVRGKKEIGENVFWGAISESKVKTIKYLDAPVIKSVTQDAVKIHIEWEPVVGAEAYTVLRKVNNGSWYKKAVVTEGTSWVDTASKTSGNTYTYSVRCSAPDGSKYTSARYTDGWSYTYLKKPVIKTVSSVAEGVKIDVSVVKCTQGCEIHRLSDTGEDEIIDILTNDSSSLLSYIDESAVDGNTYSYYVVATYNDTKVSSSSKEITYVDSSCIKYVAISGTNLYVAQDSASECVPLPYMTEVHYLDCVSSSESGSWHRVKYNNIIYYMWQDANSPEKLTDTKSEFVYTSENPYVSEMMAKALDIYKNQKTVYRHGDSTGIPDANGECGYDCSGFVSYVLRGVLQQYVPTLNYYAKVDQMYNLDILFNHGLSNEYHIPYVSIDEIKPGDLIFFNLQDEAGDETEDASMPNHVGLYLGNNEFIHCTHYNWGGNGVFIMPLDENYRSHILYIRRYVSDVISPANDIMYTTEYKTSLRTESSIESSPVGYLWGNSEVNVLFANETWAYIENAGENYFVLRQYLSSEPFEWTFEDRFVGITKLNLYSEPTTSSDKITILAETPVKYGGQFFDSNFYVVQYEGKTMYRYSTDDASADFVEDITALENNSRKYRIISSVNLRSEPNTDSAILRLIKKNEIVDMLILPNSDSTWCYIKTQDGLKGFISITKIELIEENELNE